MPFISRNPYTEEVLREYPSHDWDTIEARLATARLAFLRWRETTYAERARVLHEIANALRDDLETYATTITQEMGKPIKQARAEIEKCARGLDYFADNLESMLQPIEVETEARKSYVAFQPLGVILAIMPWNFPFWQVVRFAAPAIAAGNVVVLKPAPNTPTCAVMLRDAFDQGGSEESLLFNLFAEVEMIPDIIRHPAIAAVTFTGSTRAGREVARVAGEALKKCVLELGGSDAAIILPDAKLDHAVAQCVFGRYQNTGQSCIAMKRFIVDSLVYDEFVQQFIEQSRALRTGDPMDEATELGPLARADLRDNLHRQVQESIELGAEVSPWRDDSRRQGLLLPADRADQHLAPDACVERRRPSVPSRRFALSTAATKQCKSPTPRATGWARRCSPRTCGSARTSPRNRLEVGSAFVNHYVFSDRAYRSGACARAASDAN
jgi:succinate-semialdehyde dehydrogenase/glutarate-semialdehyde dehydrogenase